MRHSIGRWAAYPFVLLTLVIVSSAQGQDRTNPQNPPTVVVTLRSVNELLDDADVIAAMVGQEGLKPQLEAALAQFTGGLGLAGVNRSRPLGLYWNIDATDMRDLGRPVAFLPISDTVAFKKLVTTFLPKLKDSNGEWSVTVGSTKLFAKFANNYCYISQSADDLTILPVPGKIVNPRYDIAIDVNIGGVPDEIQAAFLVEAENRLRDNLRNGPPPMSDAEAQVQEFGLEVILALVRRITIDGDRMTFGVDVNRQTRLVAVDFGITGQLDTPLAASLAEFGMTSPAFTVAAPDSAPVRMIFSLPTTGMTANFDEVVAAMAKSAQEAQEREKVNRPNDNEKGAEDVSHYVFDMATATLKSGSLHSLVFIEDAGNDTLRLVAGLKVANGDDANKLFEDILKQSKNNPDLAKIKLDVANHAGARIHEFSLDPKNKQTAAFGESEGHFAVRADSLWLSIGGENLNALKKALTLSGTGVTRKGAPVSLRTKPATLMTLFTHNDPLLLDRADAIAGKAGDVFNLEIVPTKTGANLHAEFGIDLLSLLGNR